MTNPDVRRTRALIRDERNLATALRAHERRPFDAQTAAVLRERVEDLLETVDGIVSDREFWGVLREVASRPFEPEDLDRLRCVDAAALAALIQVAGYSTPPGPSPDELVDETLASIHVALATRLDPQPVRRAHSYLSAQQYRLRTQIAALDDVADPRASILRDAARTLGATSRWLIPRVVGVASDAVVESGTTTDGAGLVVGTPIAAVARAGHEWAMASVVGWARRSALVPAGPSRADLYDSLHVADPVEFHEAALDVQLRQLNQLPRYAEHDEVAHYRELLRRARRHLGRLENLARDRDLDGGYRDHLRNLRAALAEIDRRLEPAG